MEDFVISRKRESVCENNCESNNSNEETITDTPCFNRIEFFEGSGRLATIPLRRHQDYCCEPFRTENELFEALDHLNDKNSKISDFNENEVERILYRMFSSDYSSSFNIDGIATDDFGKQFVLVFLDDNQDTNLPCTIDSNGMLKSRENPEKYKDCFSKERKLKKDHIRDLLKQIAILNSDINDLSVYNETSYDEYMGEIQKVNELKEKVWNLYSAQLDNGEHYNYTQSETSLHLPSSVNTKRAQTYFQKAIDNGLLKLENGKFSWIQIGTRGGKSQLAYFCGKVFEYKHSVNGNDGTSFQEEELNELFGIDRMYSLLTQVYDAGKKQSWRRRIDELFE